MTDDALPLPDSEFARLEAIRALRILHEGPNPVFDRVTRLASRLFHVPISLMTVIDQNRQWFPSKVGLSLDETPREVAFCAHAIQQAETMVVPDAHLDLRFKDNPLVLHPPNIRFYAGVPIETADGHRIGTLCIIDQKARTLSHAEDENLRILAAVIQDELARAAQLLQFRAVIRRTGPASPKLAPLSARSYRIRVRGLAELRATLPPDSYANLCNRISGWLLEVQRPDDRVLRVADDDFVFLARHAQSMDADRLTARLVKWLNQIGDEDEAACGLEAHVAQI